MVTTLVRWGLRLITVVALFVLVFIVAVTQNEQHARSNKPVVPKPLPVQQYTAPNGVGIPPVERDDYEVVIPKPTSTATKTQAATARKSSTANNRPAVPAYSIAAAKTYAASRLSAVQYTCLANIIVRESGWDIYATNTASGAYGIPQALPGYKMASAGADWRTNYKTQIRWMISYVNDRYGSACAAWAYWQIHSNY